MSESNRMGIDSKVIALNVNGRVYNVQGIEDNMTLADVLRDKLGLMGTKVACDDGACGACTVIVDGIPTQSCMTLAATMTGKCILTIEGLLDGNTPHPIQEAFMEERGTACGSCTSGFIMTTKAFLEENPNPTVDEIKEALAGNICRCAVYEHIEKAVMSAAKKMQGGE
jgi:carbon-monoxide dehydrogenase small subunit